MTFGVASTLIRGVHVLSGSRKADARGFLERLICIEDLSDILQHRRIVQVNHARTVGKGTVRGLHLQRQPAAEMKLVHCLSGEIFDVAVDLRAGSETRYKWHAERLSGTNSRTLVIPEGVAHGFQLLSDSCDLIYFHTAAYAPEHESGVNACDARLAIPWPIEITRRSDRDEALPTLDGSFEDFEP